MMTHVMLFKSVSGCLEGQDLRLLRSVVASKMSKHAEVNAACMHSIAAWHNQLGPQNCWTFTSSRHVLSCHSNANSDMCSQHKG